MRIGIVGAGMIGGTLARLFTRAGHEVAVSNSRGGDTLRGLVDELGPLAHAATVEEAASFGEVVVLAVPWRTAEALPAAYLLERKIVVDAMNPYAEGGGIAELWGWRAVFWINLPMTLPIAVAVWRLAASERSRAASLLRMLAERDVLSGEGDLPPDLVRRRRPVPIRTMTARCRQRPAQRS